MRVLRGVRGGNGGNVAYIDKHRLIKTLGDDLIDVMISFDNHNENIFSLRI